VFLANMGPVSHHTARATYSKNFFEAGGFEVIGNDGFRDADAAVKAFLDSGATVAVICSSDKLYPDIVPQLAPKLKAAGARSVVLAGNPGANEAAYRAAGVDRFIFMKCDVLNTLRRCSARKEYCNSTLLSARLSAGGVSCQQRIATATRSRSSVQQPLGLLGLVGVAGAIEPGGIGSAPELPELSVLLPILPTVR
jgi:methylmalonyl-CoA mutase cobalamin-binding subunit